MQCLLPSPFTRGLPSRCFPASCGPEFPGAPHAVPNPRKSQGKSRPGGTPATTCGDSCGRGCCGARGCQRAGRRAINRMSATRAAVSRAPPPLPAAAWKSPLRPPWTPRTPRSAAPARSPSWPSCRPDLPTVTLTTSVCAGPRGSLAQCPSESGVWLETRPAVRGPAWTPTTEKRQQEDKQGWAPARGTSAAAGYSTAATA